MRGALLRNGFRMINVSKNNVADPNYYSQLGPGSYFSLARMGVIIKKLKTLMANRHYTNFFSNADPQIVDETFQHSFFLSCWLYFFISAIRPICIEMY